MHRQIQLGNRQVGHQHNQQVDQQLFAMVDTILIIAEMVNITVVNVTSVYLVQQDTTVFLVVLVKNLVSCVH